MSRDILSKVMNLVAGGLVITACASEPAATQVAPEVRAHHEMVYDPDQRVVLLAGGSTPLNGGQSFKFYNDIWAYSSDGWQAVGTSGAPCSGVRMAYHAGLKRVFSLGAFLPNNTIVAGFRVLNDGAWTDLNANPDMKTVEGGLVYDVFRDRLVAFGGSAGSPNQLNGDTWEWYNDTWVKTGLTGPDARQAFAMVYDVTRKVTIVYGGMGINRTLLGDTWEYDGNQWTKVSDTGPAPRMAAGFCYDSKRGMMIIFGGGFGTEMKADTWGWNGTQWIKLAEQGPTARMMGYMAYDSSRDRVVLFGGRAGWPNDLNDTWEWDGNAWKRVSK